MQALETRKMSRAGRAAGTRGGLLQQVCWDRLERRWLHLHGDQFRLCLHL